MNKGMRSSAPVRGHSSPGPFSEVTNRAESKGGRARCGRAGSHMVSQCRHGMIGPRTSKVMFARSEVSSDGAARSLPFPGSCDYC
jgi:hypothetical protein